MQKYVKNDVNMTRRCKYCNIHLIDLISIYTDMWKVACESLKSFRFGEKYYLSRNEEKDNSEILNIFQ